MVKQVFINLCVKDLEVTKAFWSKLGFSFNAQFTDEKAASLVLGDNIFVMLIIPEFFKTFTKKQLTNAHEETEAINALSVESKEEVNALVEKALAAGANETRPTDDYGWMYSRSFEDLDGHQWEIVYIDQTSIPANPAESTLQ